MIKNIKIDGFKNLSQVSQQLAPLTVITGRNSTGKSSLLQAILRLQPPSVESVYYSKFLPVNFDLVRNKYTNAKIITIDLEVDAGIVNATWTENDFKLTSVESLPKLEKSLFYLSASRTGIDNNATVFPSLISGPEGEALAGYFDQNKSTAVEDELVKDKTSLTLSAQLNYWLTYILDIPLEMHTEKREPTKIEVRYKSDGLPGLLPQQLGAGVSYLTKILILCLRSKKSDTIMIENPEIHLYPVALCRLAEFLAFIASSGRQLIVETHSNDLITKIRHEVYKGRIAPEDVIVLYKENITDPFMSISIDRNGQFDPEFPESFFDATLKELLEMN